MLECSGYGVILARESAHEHIMVRNVLCFNQVNIIIDHTASAEVLFIDHCCMLDLSGWLPLIGPDGLEKVRVSSFKANPESSDTSEQFYDSNFIHVF